MSEKHTHQIVVPRSVLIAAGILITSTMLAVALYRVSGSAPVAQVPVPQAPVDDRALRFEDRPDGAVFIYEIGEDGAEQVIHVLESGSDGFVRGVLRSLTRSRRAAGIGPEQPFLLSLQSDGQLVLEDPATGQRIDLRAFGPTNFDSFRQLLRNEGAQQ